MDQPKIILNTAMTLDGKICSRQKKDRISSDKDLKRVHKLRKEVDGIMVGVGTVLEDNPELTVRKIKGKNPDRIIVDTRGRTPLDSNVLDNSANTIIAVSTASQNAINSLEEKGAKVLQIEERKNKVDLKKLIKKLRDLQYDKILLEGGSTLNWGMLSQELVTEIRIVISPRILGGKDYKTLVGGEGFDSIQDSIKLSLKEHKNIGEEILLIYEPRY